MNRYCNFLLRYWDTWQNTVMCFHTEKINSELSQWTHASRAHTPHSQNLHVKWKKKACNNVSENTSYCSSPNDLQICRKSILRFDIYPTNWTIQKFQIHNMIIRDEQSVDGDDLQQESPEAGDVYIYIRPVTHRFIVVTWCVILQYGKQRKLKKQWTVTQLWLRIKVQRGKKILIHSQVIQ